MLSTILHSNDGSVVRFCRSTEHSFFLPRRMIVSPCLSYCARETAAWVKRRRRSTSSDAALERWFGCTFLAWAISSFLPLLRLCFLLRDPNSMHRQPIGTPLAILHQKNLLWQALSVEGPLGWRCPRFVSPCDCLQLLNWQLLACPPATWKDRDYNAPKELSVRCCLLCFPRGRLAWLVCRKKLRPDSTSTQNAARWPL